MSDDNKEFDPEETQGEEAAEQGSDSIQAETAVEETPELDSDSNSDDALDAKSCLLYTSPSPRDRTRSRMPSSA